MHPPDLLTVASPAAAMLDFTLEPNLTAEKVTSETSVMVHIPDFWHVHS